MIILTLISRHKASILQKFLLSQGEKVIGLPEKHVIYKKLHTKDIHNEKWHQHTACGWYCPAT